MIYDPLELTTELIKCRSVTPRNDGAIELLSEKLENIGFKCEIIEFSEEGTEPIKNLWAQIGEKSPCISFAGHTCLLYTSPSPRDRQKSRMPSSA